MNLTCRIATVFISLLNILNLQAQQPPDFNAQKAAGIFEYDIEEVIKKLNITDEIAKQMISESLKIYNNKMFDLSIEHEQTFKELENEYDHNIKIAMQKKDRSQMDDVKAKIKRVLPPIRKQVVAEEKILNDALAMVLSQKQNDKWLKYQKQKLAEQFNRERN
jgi:hypothetical protein